MTLSVEFKKSRLSSYHMFPSSIIVFINRIRPRFKLTNQPKNQVPILIQFICVLERVLAKSECYFILTCNSPQCHMFLSSVFAWIARMLEFFSFTKRSVSNGLGVFVKTTTGESVYVELDPKWDIASVKEIVSKKIGIDSSELKIIFAGKELQDSVTIRVSILYVEHVLPLNNRQLSPA